MSKRLRHLAVTAGVCLSVALFGCGGSEQAPKEEPAGATESAAEEAVEDDEAVEEETEQAPSGELGKAELEVASSNLHYELNQVTSFGGDRRSVSFQYDGAIVFDGSGSPQLLGIDGKPMLDGKAIKGLDYWGSGLYLVGMATDDVNNCALVSLTDGVLIGPEAATMTYATDNVEDARFIEVVYATEETDNKDECFVYSTDKAFSLSVEEGDTMYKGYAKVYDLKKHAFVDGVEITNSSRNALKDLGDAFVLEGEDDVFTMYSPKGKKLWTSDSYPSFGKRSISVSYSGDNQIIDTKGKVSYTAADGGYVSPLSSSTSDLYVLTQGEEKTAIDSQGRVVLEGTYDSIVGEFHGLFAVEKDNKTSIVNGAGEVLTDDVDEYSVSEIIPGFLKYKDGSGNDALCKSDGTLIKDVEGSMYELVCYVDNTYRVLSGDDATITLYSGSSLDKALVKGRKEESMSTVGLYDLFTGEELLDSSYEVIDWAGGYVYAFKDGNWTVYEAKRVAS